MVALMTEKEGKSVSPLTARPVVSSAIPPPDIHDLLTVEIHDDLHPKLAVLPERGVNGLLKNALCLWFPFRVAAMNCSPLFSGLHAFLLV